MEIRVSNLFRVLVIGGAVLAGCEHADERRVENEEADAAVEADAGRDAGVVASVDAGAAEEDAGVDSWLSWT